MIAFLTFLWILAKTLLSRTLALPSAMLGHRRLLPAFATPEEVGRYLVNVKYTLDLAGGLLDMWSHPEQVNYWVVFNLERGLYGDDRKWPLHIDCDDYSLFAFHAARTMPGVTKAQMYVMRYPSMKAAFADLWRNIRQGRPYWLYIHETCVIWHETGCFMLDANGCIPVKDEWDAAAWLGKQYDVTYVPQAIAAPF